MTSEESGLKSANRTCHLIGLAVSGVILFLCFVAYQSIDGYHQANLQSLRNAKSLLERKESILARRTQVEANLDEARESLHRLAARFPDTADEANILTQLFELASVTEVEIRDINPESPTVFNKYLLVRVSLRGAGTYENVCRFLNGLDDLRHNYRIANWTISGSGETDGICDIDLDIELTVAPHIKTILGEDLI